ncbi:MAG: GntR family transcriptional regulator [Maricaulaceae bacterium]
MEKLNFEIRPLDEILRREDLSEGSGLVDQIYDLLRKRIIDLSLPPELPLPEKDVAAILDASKTPVREAIIRLSREGLVNVVPKSGSYVTPINIDRYLQAYFVRVQLESGCIKRLASMHINLEGIMRLRAIVAEQKRAMFEETYSNFFTADEKFHHTLFDLAGLPDVWHTLNSTKAEIDRVRHLKRLFGVRRSESVIREHSEIIEAVAKNDPDLANQTMLAHIGGIDDEIARVSEHPHLIKTIDDLNQLVALNRKTRNKRKVA